MKTLSKTVEYDGVKDFMKSDTMGTVINGLNNGNAAVKELV
jgi:hypothetical protein